nr:hypothetical protein [Amylibacter sp.]
MRDVTGVGDGRQMPTTREVHENDEYFVSKFDAIAPIDYEILKSEISKNGPVQSVFPKENIKFVLNINKCQCSDGKCDHDCISLTQVSGFTTLTTSILRERLLECDSFYEFLHEFRHYPMSFFSSSAEQQHFEANVEQHLGFAPMDVYLGKIEPNQLTESVKLSDDARKDSWLAHNFYCGFNLLLHFRVIKTRYSRDLLPNESANLS